MAPSTDISTKNCHYVRHAFYFLYFFTPDYFARLDGDWVLMKSYDLR